MKKKGKLKKQSHLNINTKELTFYFQMKIRFDNIIRLQLQYYKEIRFRKEYLILRKVNVASRMDSIL